MSLVGYVVIKDACCHRPETRFVLNFFIPIFTVEMLSCFMQIADVEQDSHKHFFFFIIVISFYGNRTQDVLSFLGLFAPRACGNFSLLENTLKLILCKFSPECSSLTRYAKRAKYLNKAKVERGGTTGWGRKKLDSEALKSIRIHYGNFYALNFKLNNFPSLNFHSNISSENFLPFSGSKRGAWWMKNAESSRELVRDKDLSLSSKIIHKSSFGSSTRREIHPRRSLLKSHSPTFWPSS